MDLQTFPLFVQLPFELRAKIWFFALRVPRTVEIHCKKERLAHGDAVRTHVKRFTATSTPPALLHACRESRQEALQVFKPYFGTETLTQTSTVTADGNRLVTTPSSDYFPPAIYISFDWDAVKIVDTDLRYLQPVELQLIQFLIVDVGDYTYFGHYNMEHILRCSSLKSLELVASAEKPNSWSRGLCRTLSDDFSEACESHPDWRMPYVKIVSKQTGSTVAYTLPGGEWDILAFETDGGAPLPGRPRVSTHRNLGLSE